MVFASLNFVEIDVILRRGGNINRSDIHLYQFICDNYDELRSFYERFGCNLVQHPDGFFFLLSRGDVLRSRLMSKPCMHLGMFIALKMRDPEITRSSGKFSTAQLLKAIETAVPHETLQRVYAPKQREASQYERIAEEILRALKVLEDLRFLKVKEDTIRPTEAINRFAEVARHVGDSNPAAREALLTQRGVTFSDAEEDSPVSMDMENGEETGESQD